MNTFQITRDISKDGQYFGDFVLWTGDAVLVKKDIGYGVKWYDAKCNDRGTLIKRISIINLLLGCMPKDCDSIIRFCIDRNADMWQLTTDKCPTDDDMRSYGDIVLWTSYAKLYQDDNGKWWDDSCRDRGNVIDCEMVRMFFDDKIPSWKDKEIFKFGIVVRV